MLYLPLLKRMMQEPNLGVNKECRKGLPSPIVLRLAFQGRSMCSQNTDMYHLCDTYESAYASHTHFVALDKQYTCSGATSK